MELDINYIGNVLIMMPLASRIDSSNSVSFKQMAESQVGYQESVVIDLSRVCMIDTLGLHALLSVIRETRKKYGHVYLCGVQQQVEMMISCMSVDTVVPIVSSREFAVHMASKYQAA